MGASTVCTYKGNKVSVTIRDGSRTLKEGRDYRTSWRWNMEPGQGRVTITGIGSYKGNINRYFVITPAQAKIQKVKSKKKGRKASLRVVAFAQKGVGGYEFSWRQVGKKWKSARSKGKARTIVKLKKGKRYQVRVRTFKKINGKLCYGAWSKVRTVKTKR